MYFSAERLALLNQAVNETFEQSSVAWQTIPHWNTGDPSQTMVQSDIVNPSPPPFTSQALNLLTPPNDFTVTVAQAIAPTPDEALAIVIANTGILATTFDNAVFPALLTGTTPTVHITAPTAPLLVTGFIAARAAVENGGYRAPSCLVTDTVGITALSTALLAIAEPPVPNLLLAPANINSLQRTNVLATPADVRGWVFGRRQRMAHGAAADTSPGEEAVDLAVSVPPSLEVIGDSNNNINLRVRIRYALRVKDQSGLVVLRTP